MKLLGRQQIMTLNNVPIPLPLNKIDKESPKTDSDNAVEELPMAPISNCELKETPTITDTEPDKPKVESPMTKSNETEEQESPLTMYQTTARGVTNDSKAKMKSPAKEAKP